MGGRKWSVPSYSHVKSVLPPAEKPALTLLRQHFCAGFFFPVALRCTNHSLFISSSWERSCVHCRKNISEPKAPSCIPEWWQLYLSAWYFNSDPSFENNKLARKFPFKFSAFFHIRKTYTVFCSSSLMSQDPLREQAIGNSQTVPLQFVCACCCVLVAEQFSSQEFSQADRFPFDNVTLEMPVVFYE